MANVKFMYNGIKVDGVLHKGHYSKGLINNPETITIYAKNYDSFPKIEGLQAINNTDSMTDYFENDKIRVEPNNKYYKEVAVALEKQEAKRKAVREKRMSK